MKSYKEKRTEIKDLFDNFICTLDGLNFTCARKEDLNRADVQFSDEDYEEQENHLLKLYLKENS